MEQKIEIIRCATNPIYFIETYLTVMGNSLKFVKNTAGSYQGAVDIAISISLNGEIKNAKAAHRPIVFF